MAAKRNISMRDDYATICGVSEEELTTQLRQDIELITGSTAAPAAH